MSEKIILKDRVNDWLEALKSGFTLVAPVAKKTGPAEFKEIGRGDEPILDGSRMMLPPKDYLLPRYEVLLRVDKGKDGVKVESAIPENKPRVMMGVWLPDAQAITVLDRVFLDGAFKDPYYAARRENTLVAAVIPAEIRWSWFCGSVDDVEKWKRNVDLLMFDLGDRYWVESHSEKGADLMQGEFFKETVEADGIAANQLWDKFKNADIQKFAGKALYENLSWDSDVWGEIAQKCISCGICSYMCPSCTCFDMQDESCGSCVERYRCRDTCQFEDFTLMGAGHNPREQRIPRSRQRLMHKFQYQHEQFGVVGCTGCGRCVEQCPVNVDIRDVLNRVCSVEREEPVEG